MIESVSVGNNRAGDSRARGVSKVIYIVEFPFNDRDFERFGLELLAQRGFEVEVWDVTALTRRRTARRSASELTRSGFRLLEFTERHTLKAAIVRCGEGVFAIVTVTYRIESLFLYRALKHLKYGLLASNAGPIRRDLASPRAWLDRIQSATAGNVARSVFWRSPHRLLGAQPATAVFMATRDSVKVMRPLSGTTTKVATHAFDYDLFLRASASARKRDFEYAVFLDQYLPFHPDWQELGGPPITADDYYPRLRAFFDFFESVSSLRVIVAAHPRSDYRERHFGDREVVKGETAELVFHAGCVLAGTSQSVVLAVLARKPIVFVTMNAFLRSDQAIARQYGVEIEVLANSLGKLPFNVDGGASLNWNVESQIDAAAYDAFIKRFIKEPDSPKLPYWEIVARYLSGLKVGDPTDRA